MSSPSILVVGTILALDLLDPLGGVPRTRVTLSTTEGAQLEFIVPGANGGPPGAVVGMPILSLGESWRVELTPTGQGWVPEGLGRGLERADGRTPIWNLNGIHYQEESVPFTFLLNEAGSADLGVDATELTFVASMEQWSNVGCSTWSFAYSGRTSLGIEDDGINVVAWEDVLWEWGENVLGMSITRFESDDDTVFPIGADILYNGADFDWTTEPGDGALGLMNAGSIITHELGHVTGMDHEYFLVTSTMFYGYLGGDWMATTAGDDRRGLCENYPSGLDECEVDKDCVDIDASPRRCVELDGVSVCDELRDPQGAECDRTWFNCEEYCLFTNRAATEGYCTVDCPDEECPEGYHCGDAGFIYPDEAKRVCLLNDPVVDSGDSGQEPDTAPTEETGLKDTSLDEGGGDKGTKSCGCVSGGETSSARIALLGALLGLLVGSARRRA